MAYDVVVRGGTVVTASDAFVADLAIQGGRIVAVAGSIPEGREEIDARGLLVLPGGVDVHTHLDVEVGGVTTADDFESGTAAAACGGITTICDYAWQRRGQTILDALETWKRKGDGQTPTPHRIHATPLQAPAPPP